METGFVCGNCDRWFASEHALGQHCDALYHWDDDSDLSESSSYDDDDYIVCGECGQSFGDEQALAQHCAALNHPFGGSDPSEEDDSEFVCGECGRIFGDDTAVYQHCDALGHWDYSDDDDEFTCGDCGRTFGDEHALDQHCDALGHFGEEADEYFCRHCDRSFGSQQALDQHCNALGHGDATPSPGQPVSSLHVYQNEYSCSYCDRSFASQQALEQHCAAANHGSVTYDSSKSYSHQVYAMAPGGNCNYYEAHGEFHCVHCVRAFQSWGALQMHFKSPQHQYDGLNCPFCRQSLASAAGLANHLEMGACPNTESNRDSVYHLVLSKDPKGLITKNILQWGAMQYSATDLSWNGSGYECYLCHQVFTQLNGLNQHLNSAVHEAALYHCPSKQCGDFQTLGAIISHLESEACGLARFTTVQNTLGGVLSHGNLVTF